VEGVEASAELVAQCRASGFEATLGGLRSHLESVAEGSLAGLILTRVADRHPTPSWPRLVGAAWRSLGSGGVVLFEGIADHASLARLRWLCGRQRFSIVDSRAFPESGAVEHVLIGRRAEG
jgi:hypothetical protein